LFVCTCVPVDFFPENRYQVPTKNNTDFAPGKNGNLSGGKHINFPQAFLQNDSGVKIRLK
jgi:hypothetical protein